MNTAYLHSITQVHKASVRRGHDSPEGGGAESDPIIKGGLLAIFFSTINKALTGAVHTLQPAPGCEVVSNGASSLHPDFFRSANWVPDSFNEKSRKEWTRLYFWWLHRNDDTIVLSPSCT